MINKIQIDCLGKLGRFGNSLFQYCVTKKYAKVMGVDFEINGDWQGIALFNLKDKVIKEPLEIGGMEEIKLNTRVYGFFQDPRSLSILRLNEVREWLTVDEYLMNLTKQFETVCHVRQGDSLNDPRICHPTESSYSSVFPTLMDKPFWLKENESNNPFWIDFLTMVKCKYLIRSPSTFAYWAGVLNLNRVFSPIITDNNDTNCTFIESRWPRTLSPKTYPGSHQGEMLYIPEY